MKRLILLALIAIGTTGCDAGNPFAPLKVDKVDQYICSTKPRQYILPSGKVVWEVDHYTSKYPCPKEPID